MFPRLLQPLPGEPTRIWREHPLARHLVTALCFNQTGYAITNAVTGQLAGTVTNRTIASERRRSPTGVALGTNGTNPGTSVGLVQLTSPGWLASTDGTIVVRARWVLQDSPGAIICESAGTVGGLYFTTGGIVWLYPAMAATGGPVAVGQWATIAVTRSAAGAVQYYTDGVLVSTDNTGTTVAMPFNWLFNNSNDSSLYNGDIEFIHIWNGRILSAGEIYDQFVNPYGLYERSLMTNTLYHFPSGAAIPPTPYYYRQHITRQASV